MYDRFFRLMVIKKTFFTSHRCSKHLDLNFLCDPFLSQGDLTTHLTSVGVALVSLLQASLPQHISFKEVTCEKTHYTSRTKAVIKSSISLPNNLITNYIVSLFWRENRVILDWYAVVLSWWDINLWTKTSSYTVCRAECCSYVLTWTRRCLDLDRKWIQLHTMIHYLLFRLELR